MAELPISLGRNIRTHMKLGLLRSQLVEVDLANSPNSCFAHLDW